MKKRFLAMMCSIMLCIQLAIPAVGLLAEAENKAIESTNPFALMYDSDERLAESLEEQWDILMKTHTKEIQMEGDQSAQMSEESAGEFSSSAREPDQSSLSRSQDKNILQQRIVSLARSGNLKDVQDFALPEEAAEQIERMVEDSGESRFIVKYRHSARRGQDAETLRSHSAEKQALEGGLELLTLPERVNPAIFAEELRASGMEGEIEYIQPDFALSIDSLRLTAVEEQPGDEAVEVPPVPKEGEIPLPDEGETPADETLPEEQSGELQDEPEELHDEPEKPTLEEETSHSPIPVTVALIDTGVDTSHPALKGYLGEGWNFVADTPDIHNPEHPLVSGHGTHLAGIIARTAEEYGADVTILPLKVFENGAAHTSDIIAAIVWAEEHGAAIINCSFGSTNENPALYDSITASSALFVAAAGNSRRDLSETPSYPACYDLPNLISVGSVNTDGGFSYFSNYSSDLLDITALGRDVISAVPGGEYATMTGTSMAAVQVTGAVAVAASLSGTAAGSGQTTSAPVSEESLYWDDLMGMYLPEDILPSTDQKESALNSGHLRELLLNSADRLYNLQNKAEDGRRLNLDNVLAGIEGKPLNLAPADDFDVYGYQPTPSEAWALYAASGKVVEVAGGSDHTLVLKEDGSVWAWGQNYDGQLGDGMRRNRSTPEQVIGLAGVEIIAAGYYHSLAVKSDGSVWTWGNNSYGQLGDGTTANRSTPEQVIGLTDIVAIAAGYAHSLAVKSDGSVWAWGYNYGGELGDGTTTPRITPVRVSGITDVAAIAAGNFHSLAVKSDGSVWTWGYNGSGQLGDGTTTNRNTPEQVSGLTDVAAVAAGEYYSLAVKSDGSVWAWGYNYDGELGDGTTTNRSIPVRVIGLTDVDVIAAGYFHSLAVKSDGSVWAWGYNYDGQLGDGTTTQRSTPGRVIGLTDIASIAAGYFHSMAVKGDGSVWAWGQNDSGQLGDGTMIDRSTSAKVSGLIDIETITAGQYHSLAVKSDGSVWAWGQNSSGQLGDGTTVTRSTPVQVSGLTDVATIVAGYSYSLALKGDGNVWAWGYNSSGQLGNGTTTPCSTPVQVISLTDVAAIAAGSFHSLAVKSDGSVWAWGYNYYGQLGDGTTATRSTPVRVSGLTDIVAIAAGTYHSLAIKNDGSVWVWGQNNYGQLGDGTTTPRSTPVRVSELIDVEAIAAGYNHSLAVKSDGSVWAWGDNDYGQLGDGTTIDHSTPVQVSGLTDIVTIAAGEYYSLAVKSDGSAWAWGQNSSGQLGDGTTTIRSKPVQVSGLTDIAAIVVGYNHSLAVTGDGNVCAWGNDEYGQLGQGRILQTSTAIRVAMPSQPWLEFDELSYSMIISNTTLQVSATAYDAEGNKITGADITYSLAVPYHGVIVDAVTGLVTVTVGALPGIVTLKASCNGLETTVSLIIKQDGNTDSFELELSVTYGASVWIALSAFGVADFDGTLCTLTYDASKLALLDAAAQKYGADVVVGTVSGVGITIESIADGELVLSIDKDTPEGKTWSGVLTLLEFKALVSGETTVTVSSS